MGDPTELREDFVIASAPAPARDLPKSHKKAQELLYELRRQRERNQLLAVLSTEAGLAVLGRILNRCGIYAKAGVISESDQGKRAIGMQLVYDIDALSDDAYPDFLRTFRKLQRVWAEEDNAASGVSGKPQA